MECLYGTHRATRMYAVYTFVLLFRRKKKCFLSVCLFGENRQEATTTMDEQQTNEKHKNLRSTESGKAVERSISNGWYAVSLWVELIEWESAAAASHYAFKTQKLTNACGARAAAATNQQQMYTLCTTHRHTTCSQQHEKTLCTFNVV